MIAKARLEQDKKFFEKSLVTFQKVQNKKGKINWGKVILHLPAVIIALVGVIKRLKDLINLFK